MYLSKLEIFGFKSFAQKVQMSFDAGITSVVGPNGCGKTNVVDALRWALGEQRPTTLRSDKMEDVIFNGTKSRKPLSVAEVSITIENTKGILPTEYSEVTITRRVFRSGESEYYLNKTLCRLKDIRDLFMDTGMGSDAYSVIELKMIESILSDSSEERRRLFEESAGVTKYKFRRKEATRRLEVVRQDLTRVGDIVRNVEKAVNGLERQAQKAQKYNEFVKTLQELETELMLREYSGYIVHVSPLEQQLAVVVTEKNRIEVELKQEDALLDVLRGELRELEAHLTATQEDLSALQSRVHELDQEKATGQERRRSLDVNIRKYEKEKTDLEQKRKEVELQQEELGHSLERVRTSVAEAERAYKQRKSQLDACEERLNARKADQKAAQERVMVLLREIAVLRNRENQARARVENVRGRIGYIREENAVYRNDVEKNAELIGRLTAENRELRRSFAEAEVRAHQMEDYKARLSTEIDELRQRNMEVMGEMERKQARIDFVKGLVESYDGYSEGTRYLIASHEWSSQIQTTVGEALTSDPEYRVAIETALGEAAGYIIVKDIEHAYAAMDFLKKNKKGKATFICLNRLPQIANHRAPVHEPGFIGWANNLVRYEPAYEPLFNFLFDDTLLVRDVEAAHRIVDLYPNARCVTLEGEVISGKGLVRGGSLRQDEGGHISKKSQLEELGVDLQRQQGRHAQLQVELREKRDELEGVDLKKLIETARRLEQQKTSVEVRIAQLEFEKRRAEENVERNETEDTKLNHEIATLTTELDTVAPSLAHLESERAESERKVGVTTSAVEQLEAEWNESARITNEANLQIVGLRSEERSVLQSRDHAASTLSSIDATFARRSEEIAAAHDERAELGHTLEQIDASLSSLRVEFKEVQKRKESVDKEFALKRSAIHQIELKLKDERLRQEGSLKAAHDLEFKIQELRMKADALKVRAKEDFDIDIEFRDFPDADTFDMPKARENERVLKERIHALGPVNFAAFDEYKSEKERLDFMTAQRDDLLESERTLQTTINEINTTAQQLFLRTFELIRENFVSTFKELFDEGDECDLHLEEGVDPLEARIEITAKPRGKRPTSIDLLSGGEKTLTSIALLFAIYLVKPSPFCILDEVDAPLDDTNIDRFTRILRKFSDNTQFVVVTHNKRTMEAASALYGVTMEEEGVSKLVSVRFQEPAKVGQ